MASIVEFIIEKEVWAGNEVPHSASMIENKENTSTQLNYDDNRTSKRR